MGISLLGCLTVTRPGFSGRTNWWWLPLTFLISIPPVSVFELSLHRSIYPLRCSEYISDRDGFLLDRKERVIILVLSFRCRGSFEGPSDCSLALPVPLLVSHGPACVVFAFLNGTKRQYLRHSALRYSWPVDRKRLSSDMIRNSL